MQHSSDEVVDPELRALVEAYCEGGINDSQLAELERCLQDNFAAQEFFLAYGQVCASLEWAARSTTPAVLVAEAELQGQMTRPIAIARQQALGRAGKAVNVRPQNWAELWRLGIEVFSQPLNFGIFFATVSTVSLLLFFAQIKVTAPSISMPVPAPSSEMHGVAQVTGLVEDKWADTVRSAAVSQPLYPNQRLELRSGFAELTFATGARVLLEGPATVTLGPSNEAALEHGKLTVRVTNQQAVGFAIRTPTARIVDLGTEFGVQVLPAGDTIVRVFAGRVVVDAKHPTPARDSQRELSAGQQMWITTAQRVIPKEDEHAVFFTRSLQDAESRQFVARRAPDKVVPVCQDAHVEALFPDRTYGRETHLLVKHSPSKDRLEREAWLKFDLAGVARERIVQARLRLALLPDQWETSPTSARPSKWDFQIAALTDQKLLAWREGDLEWRKAGATERQPLVQFNLVGPGEAGEPVLVEGAMLAQFLRMSDQDKVTLLITGLTTHSHPPRRFVSREHHIHAGAELQLWMDGPASPDLGEVQGGGDAN